jgi:Holliday junction resolvasome RuvABC endonuclease subunit
VKVLGLDVSTSNVGVCLLDTEQPQRSQNIVAMAIPMSKIKGLYTKACAVENEIKKIAMDNSVDVIVVEAPLQAFRSRMSSAGTIAKLNRFNGIVSFIARSTFDKPVVLGNVIAVRKSVGIVLDKKSEKSTKEQIFDWVKNRPEFSNFCWPTKVLRSGPNSGETRYENYCYDISDAFVVALWGTHFLNIDDLDSTIL